MSVCVCVRVCVCVCVRASGVSVQRNFGRPITSAVNIWEDI